MTHCSTEHRNPLDLHFILNSMEAKNCEVPSPPHVHSTEMGAKKSHNDFSRSCFAVYHSLLELPIFAIKSKL